VTMDVTCTGTITVLSVARSQLLFCTTLKIKMKGL
jgi:hypothetical protein